MKLLTRLKGLVTKAPQSMSGVDSRGWTTIFDFRPFAWQQSREYTLTDVLANWALFACMTLIAGDVGKLRLRLMRKKAKIWEEFEDNVFSPLLKKPNHYQIRQRFIEQWLISKLSYGNAYILKERDAKKNVVRLYVLDAQRVTPLVADNGDVYYSLRTDILSGVMEDFPAVPASEIIHDRMNCLYHPLVGLSPIYASALAASQGLKIQQNSEKFFENMSRPGGVLTAPAKISDELALRMKNEWQKNYSGENVGRVAVLGEGLKYEAMSVNPIDAQLVEQSKISAEQICATFHVPSFKIGAGTIPAGQKVEDLNQIYYSDCLQSHLESMEALLDDGLGVSQKFGIEFDLDGLLRMDTTTQVNALKMEVDGGWMAPNEARQKRNMPPVEGGESPMIQQQNFSLAALAKRDAQDDPFGSKQAEPAPVEPEEPDVTDKALHCLYKKAPEECYAHGR